MNAPGPRKYLSYAVLFGVVLIFFAPLALTNRILARGDTFLYFYPYWHLAQEALLSGRIPLWNPTIFMGAPLLANSQMGFYYPLNWPLWWGLSVPYAASASIVLHVVIAGWGMIALGRRGLKLSWPAALLSAIGVACGGYLTAQVEHINQLQGLAWLPWLLLLGLPAGDQTDGRSAQLRRTLLIGLLFALQIVAGHLQTVFISGIALGGWLLAQIEWRSRRPPAWVQDLISRYWPLAAGTAVALLLAAAQLWPSLELTNLSSRAGGLSHNEVVSFSWPPWLVPQALLPAFNQPLFTEYSAFLPLTVWVLVGVAVGWGGRRRQLRPLLFLAVVGGWLALGRYGFVYSFLATLPGFDLFRVPARWLIVFTIPAALLAGIGLDRVRERGLSRKQKVVPILVGAGLIVAQFPAVWASRLAPPLAEAPAVWPTLATVALQLGELVLIAVWVWRPDLRIGGRFLPLGLSTIVLFVASRALPYANPTTPEAYFDRRPPSLRLAVEGAGEIVPPRYLSVSDIFFDPGDGQEIATIYEESLSAGALYDYTIAIKLKEIVAPNLSAVYGLSAVDGFDGGILPLASYSDLMARTVLDGQTTTDGRLREFLVGVPERRWLSMLGVGYVITDKTGDVWREGVFFDRQLPLELAPLAEEEIDFLPNMTGTALWVLSAGEPGKIRVTFDDGRSTVLDAAFGGEDLWKFRFGDREQITSAEVVSGAGGWTVTGISLVNEEDGTFFPLVAGPFRLIHSGDVKLYSYSESMKRAVLIQPGSDSLLGQENIAGDASIKIYEPTRVEIGVEAAEPARLVLLEANYPGWEVAVDGQPAEIVTIDRFFRGVDLPPGRHDVTFRFRSRSARWGGVISLVALVSWMIGWIWISLEKKRDDT